MSSRPVDPESAAHAERDRNLFAAAATGVTADVLEWWHEDGVLDDMTIARRFARHGGATHTWSGTTGRSPDLDFTPGADHRSPAIWPRWSGPSDATCEADSTDVAADGRELRIRAMDLFGIRDGKVAWESSWYGDAWMRRRLERTGDGSGCAAAAPRGA